MLQRLPLLGWWKHELKATWIPYPDGNGRQVEFRAGTRETLRTRMHRANVPLAAAMLTMRHTDARLTLVDYTDDEQLGIEQTALPEVMRAPKSPQLAASVQGA